MQIKNEIFFFSLWQLVFAIGDAGDRMMLMLKTFSISHSTHLMAQACYPERWFPSCLMQLCWAPFTQSSHLHPHHWFAVQPCPGTSIPPHTGGYRQPKAARGPGLSCPRSFSEPCRARTASLPRRWGGLSSLEIVWVSCDGSCPHVES